MRSQFRFAASLTVAALLLLIVAGDSSSQTSALVCGGQDNGATRDFAVACGGRNNQATGTAAAILGGLDNVASGERAFIGAGFQNRATGQGSVVPGGRINNAEGDWSFAAGRRAKARHEGAFVWADSTFLDFPSTAKDQFSARATGGVRFVTNVSETGTPTTGVVLNRGSGSWSSLSDRNAKENFTDVDPQEVLEKLSELDIQSWNYRSQAESDRHLGPTAQDFHAAFGLGPNDRYITNVDADGVALVAIQALHDRLEDKDAQIDQLRQELSEVRASNREVKARMETLLERVDSLRRDVAELRQRDS